ncbi:hypothetical protein [Allosalinactinospora lopnorensis]|uniref:hypothetical protein n=1 Tax=Allosalinactinospora lopnorensis TaxID=1352348 RepID=UPI000623CD22|nr:hypothetical protein [Allosalinactinospora lopnorensis]
MLPPDEGFRADIAGRMERVGSEEDLAGVLGDIEQRISGVLREGSADDPIELLGVVEAWAALLSYAMARFYAPGGTLRTSSAGWGDGTAYQVRRAAEALREPLQSVVNRTDASRYSIIIAFPWGVSIGLSGQQLMSPGSGF